jgi:hypothetical protein
MIRHNDTTHALLKIVNAMLLVLLVGCEELGIGPQTGFGDERVWRVDGVATCTGAAACPDSTC